MKVEIIAIGDELLIGQTIDTNSAWIGEQLFALNFEMIQVSKIRDEKRHILDALKVAENRSDIILITGGLGPTKDDITKETLCEYFNTGMVQNEKALENIKRIFKQSNRELLQVNKDQALLPANSKYVENLNGTAPGMWFDKDGKTFVSMPGVPYEMKPMMEKFIIPKLLKKYQPKKEFTRTILTEGIAESILAFKLGKWESDLRAKNMKLAYLPSPGQIRLRISSSSQKLLNDKVGELHNIIPEYIFGEGKEKLEQLVGELLKSNNKTVSTAESCTGGYVSHLITSVSGSSSYYLGSVVSYANEVKRDSLDVSESDLIDYGAVSKQVVEQMAEGARKNLKTDYSVATSGIAGPDGGTKEKPVGTVWIAIASDNEVISEKFDMGNNRERTIQKTAVKALSMLRKQIIKENEN